MICKIYSCWDDTLNNSDYCHRHCSMNRLQAEMIETKETLEELRTIDIEDIAPSDLQLYELYLESLTYHFYLMKEKVSRLLEQLEQMDNDKNSSGYRKIDPNIRNLILKFIF